MPVPPTVRLANEIAAQFHHQSADRAAAAIAQHIRAFWEPRMREELLQHTTSTPEALDPLVVAAARLVS
ncbi:formate dehydrogenase subunit delta [Saccharothrix sp.]|uniref:formate dehydrogenase subunit delta n=1 Tax=Saccharothrix sp. TaxID=1873460 RepID=UPI0028123D7B|nr:formate dehydrogenase subunit delta [Saccharothrix sp.]